jgi:Carboxypeptidase regulatory-like domain
MKKLLLAMFAIGSFFLHAQDFRGTLSGLIADPTGAPVPGAKVTVTEIHTGTKTQTVADSAGEYTAPFLLPGDYNIAAEAPSFKQFLRQNLHLGSGEHVVIDMRLEVGDASQSVSVSADAPLLTSENASVGQAITTKEVEELPLNGRTPMVLASLSLGVIATGQPGLIHPFDAGGAAGWSVGGGYAQTSEILVDGSPNATWDGRLAYSVPQDAVQEVRVKAFDTDAAFGHTGGGTINQVIKGGTNSLHGEAYEFTQPNTLVANNFFNNAKGVARPVTHYNQYGLEVQGPVVLPKIYDGRNKLFWLFAWESLKDSQPNANFTTVPTDAMRGGDLSLYLTADKTTIYNPYTGVQSGSTITRSPFPNNVIPTSLLNPIALNYLKFFPEPNVTPTRADGFQNFANNATTNDDYNNELGRIDYNMSEKNRMFFDIRSTGYSQLKNNYFNNISTGSLLYRNNWGGSVDDVYVFNASNVVNVRFNFTRLAEVHALPSSGFDPTSLGFPASIAANSEYLQLPVINFSSNSGFQALGATGANNIPSQSAQLFGDWVKIKGNHTFKFGGDGRQYRLNTFTAGNSTGTYSFSGNSYVRASSSASSTVVSGQDFASFLLGLPYSATYDLNTYGSWYSYYSAVFAQDDWRVTRTLTVNLGARFDHDSPYHEKYGRTVNGFDNVTPSPLAPAAQAAYAKNPIPQLPVSEFNPVGGLTFPSGGNSAAYNNTSHLISPRVGFAWSPDALHQKTVIRGGFGMFVSPVTISTLALTGAYSTNPITNQEGFSQSTSPSVTSNNYLTPGLTLNNAFAGGLIPPAGSTAGLNTFAGQNIMFLSPNVSNPYAIRWNFGFQQQLTHNMLFEAVYVGNHGVHLPVAVTQINGLPRSLLSTLPTRDPAQNYLSNTVANPFAGLQTSQNTATTSVAQLLSKYPQFPIGYSGGSWSGGGGILEQNLNVGSSYFESMNLHLQQRASNNLFFTFNYIFSKLIEKDSWLNDTDAQPEKRISPSDHPQRFVVAASYQLPIGKGQRFDLHSGWANAIAGDWHINTIYTFQVGAPVTWVNGSSSTPGDYVYLGGPLSLDPRDVNGVAFNTAAFDTKAADAFNYHIRTFSTTFPNLRADGINQFDASILKRIMLPKSEGRRYLELRFEGFNMANHAVFAAPNTTATNAAFGTITATANLVRTIQMGARIVF